MLDDELLQEARRVMTHEGAAVMQTANQLGMAFVSAVYVLDDCRRVGGTVHVSGIGKSGDIGRKIAATLTSMGTPAVFLHPVEALHGDLGRVRAGDVCVLLSRSGACHETVELAARLATLAIKLVAITSNADDGLALYADHVVRCHHDGEADALGLAPTASTAAALAVGDALALCLASLGSFSAEDFRATHPGGALGNRTDVANHGTVTFTRFNIDN